MIRKTENNNLSFLTSDILMRAVMTIRVPLAFALLSLTSLLAFAVSPETSKLEAMYNKAFQAFDNARYDEALSDLDAIDAKQPNLAESLNLRGVVYMRQGKYDKAEAALRKALSLESKFWNASFNLAEIPFLKKDWAEARNRFEALIAADNQGMQPETVQLIQYKILLTFVLQGKENTVDWILNKFEQAKDSPALYFSNAAIAFKHGNQKEAKEWISSADKRFSGSLNKLYSESFYEVGWMQKPAGEARLAVEITSTTERAERVKADAKANFEKAERAFQQRNFEAANSYLDQAEAGLPNDPANQNLRGEILLEQDKYDQAEAEFRKAFAANPKFRQAQYNLAQVPFKKRNYQQAQDRFEALFAETPGDDKNQASQLIKYKVFLTILLQGKDDQAQQLMDQFKFTGDTPALYYAHAAWEYKHGHSEQGEDWIRSARKIYSQPLNLVFGDSFYDLGWLNKETDNTLATTSALAQAEASPLKGPTPAMRLGPAEDVQPPTLTEATVAQGSALPGATPNAALALATPGLSVIPAASPAATVATLSAATASTSPAVTTASIAPAPTASVAQLANAAAVAIANGSAAPAANPSTTPAASPAVALASSTTTPGPATSPGTHLASTEERAWSSTFGEMAERFSRPANLLVAVLLLGGILLLIGLVVQQARRNLASVYHSSTPLTEPPFAGEDPSLHGDMKTAHSFVSTGPPKLSLNLKATEPTVGSVLAGGAITARGETTGLIEPPVELPNEPEEERTTVVPSIATVSAKVGEAGVPPFSVPPSTPLVEPVLEKPAVDPAVAPVAAAKAVEPIAEKVAEPNTARTGEPWTEKIAEPVVARAAEPVTPPPAEAPARSIESLVEKPAAGASTPSRPTEAQPPEKPILEKLEPTMAEVSAVPETSAAPEPISFETKPETTAPEKLEEAEPVTLPERFEEPVGQGQPVPELTTALSPEPVLSELTQPEPEAPLELIEPEEEVAAPIAGHRQIHSPIETPSFASKIISTEPIRLQPTTIVIMPETTITPAASPTFRTSSPTMSVQQPAGGMHTAVQLTFSLEIASMQLTPTFKMSGLQLKPTSKVVSMRLAPSQDPQPPMNLQVTFEVARIDLSSGSIGSVRLSPSAQQKPAVLTSSSFAISGLELVAGSGSAPVQLTPSHQEQASVHLTAEFQIAAIEFTPLFEISAIVLNSTSRKVSMQLPGSGPSSIEGAPVFQIEDVQLGPGN
jgi:tetratricopeptide (TPR) repeat protein